MANTVTFKIKVGDDGTFKIVTNEAKKASKATDELGKSTDRTKKKRNDYSKQEKGVGQLTNNSTKAFAKQAQTIGSGNLGLVGAYAALMANVFAVSQAFGFLQRSAGVQQLMQGLEETGNIAGRNLGAVSEELKKITGAALSTADAMKSVALGMSAGFSEEQMKGLARVATGASKALGRDLADAMDRLTRGAAKLESEIVDELGIMIRLDDVAREYAVSLGKTADELTNFEKRMAFTNAIIEQGEKKFGHIADAVDHNPYNQLAAAFDDLTKSAGFLLTTVVNPLIKFLGSSPAALGGVIAAFGAMIAKTVTPSLADMTTKLSQSSREAATFATQNQKAFFKVKGLSQATQQVQERMKEGSTNMYDHGDALRVVTEKAKENRSEMVKLNAQGNKDSEDYAIREKRLVNQKKALKQLTSSVVAGTKAQIEHKQAQAVAFVQAGEYGKAMKKVAISFKTANTNASIATAGLGKFTTAMVFAKVNSIALAGALKVLGIAFLQVIPIIGQIIAILTLFWSGAKAVWKWFAGENHVANAMDEINERMTNFDAIGASYIARIQGIIDVNERFSATATTLGGMTEQMQTGYTSLIEADKQQDIKEKKGGDMFLQKGTLKAIRKTAKGYIETLTTMRNATNPLSEDFGLLNAQIAANQVILNQADKALDEGAGGMSSFNLAFENQIKIIGRNASGLVGYIDTINNAADANNNLKKEVTALEKKETTRFDKLLAARKNIESKMKDAGAALATGYGQPLNQSLQKKGQQNFLDSMGKSDVTPEALIAANELLETDVKTLATKKEDIKIQRQKIKDLKKYSGESDILYKQEYDAQTQLLVLQKEQEQAALNILKHHTDHTKTKDQQEQIQKNITALTAEIKDREDNRNLVLIETEKHKIRINKLDADAVRHGITLLEQEKQRAIFQKKKEREQGGRDTAVQAAFDERKINKEINEKDGGLLEAKAKLFLLELSRIDAEHEMLKLRAQIVKEELVNANKSVEGINKVIGGIERSRTMARGAAASQYLTDIQNITDAGNKDLGKVTQGAGATAAAAGQGTYGQLNAMAFADEGKLTVATEAYDTMGEKVSMVTQAIRTMGDQMKAFGPDGEIVGTMIEGITVGIDTMMESFETMGDASESRMAQTAAGFQMAAAAIGMLSSMTVAHGKMKMATLDKEIDAEKKRDGQSAKSVEKIKKLEKEKEKIDKDTFERNKKLQVLQAIMNTAAGITMALATLEPPYSYVMAGITGAMGLAQVALIKKMEYGGGAGAEPQATAPAAVAAGARSNQVDLAKSQSAAGEQSYLRGASGIGGPNNFRPAMVGARYNRVTGGGVGYMVGEQGPELFMPETTGEILSATETEEILDEGAGGTNVTFNINAIDTLGVQDLLQEQRGNIIEMIREAANNAGEGFLEGVVD